MFDTDMFAEARVAYLKRMLANVRHRGPDEMGYYFDEVIAMGTARLSIVDLKSGQQPIGDANCRYWICFNGEIHSYKELRVELIKQGSRFSTNSDTEVVLNARIVWGHEALERLNGAFAFSIYDKYRRSLVLARDRFGKRPLYYIQEKSGLAYGSEMKCFLAYDPFRFEFDSEQLASIFRIWTPIENQSGFKGIKQVPSGSYLYADRHSVRITSFTPLELAQHQPDLSEGAITDWVHENLSESVRLRLRSDVEVGVYLSGGIDSAIIAQLVTENSAGTTKSVSIEFDDVEFDESADQELLSKHLGTNHASVIVGSQDIFDAFPIVLWHAEVPVFRTAFVSMFLLSKWVKECGIKVAMTGEGADEAFLGCDIFKETLLRSTWTELGTSERQAQLARLYPYLRQCGESNQASLHAFFNQFSKLISSELLSHQVRFHNSTLSGRLLSQKYDGLECLRKTLRATHEGYAALSIVQKAQWLEFKTLLGGYWLSTQGDRTSLANSVENRRPFLDPKIVQLGSATNLMLNDGSEEKYLLKKAFSAKLPRAIIEKRKQPYRAPDASPFLRTKPAYLEAIQSEHELKKIGVLDTKFCLAFINRLLVKPVEHIGQAENQTFVFLLSLATLHDQFISRNNDPFVDIDALLVKKIDGRISL
jgi:asparagine synthase (glutamine-hydrolysing)